MADQREYDLVLFGATGFTGGLTAEYLARHVPAGCRWALAGRNPAKLEDVRRRLAAITPGLEDLPLLHADATDPASLAAVAGAARVVVTTVGPYIEYGEPLVAACAEAGTDYVDLTGEPEFADLMYVRHHTRATQTGARIVHACGFDSVPHDLGVLFTVQQLPEGVPLRVRGMLRAGGTFSGGTFHSAVTAFSRGRQTKQASAARRKAEPRPADRRVRAGARPPHRDAATGWWLVPLPTIDPLVVKRSAAALERYGPDFEYAHYAAVKRLPTVVGGIAGMGALVAAAQVPPLRRLILSRVPQGEGPSEERRARSWFSVRFVGEGGGRRVRTEVSGGDPGYGETAKMLAESALCLAFDDNPPSAGCVTTAVAMGDRLIGRLVKAGIGFEVLEDAPV
ncbi:saccharopine dehydrogenase NADP-binding domain-containing protein [Nocardioides sp. WL0053]|uniref:Saccharopine dehydrogenase NADP-binding domain-containing protein n=1 Tax=Nocardioides jiangsuensis TaxID=2866161 RepID=A0ABS7RJB1_9ACTN|nr:saccharopine dehydrogenase NADP-binding domain-containing protein [Nocardioides jiangsuensis]MBY9075137.1 saccharopine dehydrogenase NADP-binding domain-containing protein [Nocardioides jiangsuensis]